MENIGNDVVVQMKKQTNEKDFMAPAGVCDGEGKAHTSKGRDLLKPLGSTIVRNGFRSGGNIAKVPADVIHEDCTSSEDMKAAETVVARTVTSCMKEDKMDGSQDMSTIVSTSNLVAFPVQQKMMTEEESEISTNTLSTFKKKQPPGRIFRPNPAFLVEGLMPQCDFEVNPTQLSRHIHARLWSIASRQAINFPVEARTWVLRWEPGTRADEGGKKLRWMMLPLHFAMIFSAPVSVVDALLKAYPAAAHMTNDQGMLPLHLAYRNGVEDSVTNLLIAAYPQGVYFKDYKGRVPLEVVLPTTKISPHSAQVGAVQRERQNLTSTHVAAERATVITLIKQKMIEGGGRAYG